MINLPSLIKKDEALVFSLNKSQLFAQISDDYFSNENNVEKIVFVYKSTEGHQRKRIEFLTSQETPSTSVVFSQKAKSTFFLENIVLIDYDGGTHVVSSSIVSSSARTLDFQSSSIIYFAFSGTNDPTLGGFGSIYDESIGGQFF